MPSDEREKKQIARNNRREDKPTTPRLPKSAVWGTCLLMLGLFLLTSIGYFGYNSLNSSAPSGDVAAATSADSPAQKPQSAPTPSHGILERLRSVWGSTPKTTEPAQNRPQVAEQRPAAAPSEAILQAALTPSDEKDAPQAKLSPDLEGIDANANINVIVQFKGGLNEENLDLVRAQGGNHLASLHLINAATFTLQGRALKALAAQDQIAYITPDRRVSGALDSTAAAVNAQVAWTSGYTGSSDTGIAVIDSGVSDLPDFYGSESNHVVYSQSFVPNDSSTSDVFGHGTHVAGIAAGTGKNSTGSSYSRTFKGIAPKARIINLRVLNQYGVGSDSAVISAIQKAIALKDTYKIRVINLSLGRQVFESYKLDPLCQAVEQAWQAGIVVVVAAGNQGRNNSAGTNGYDTIAAPGNDPFVITVGAMNTKGTPGRTDDVIATYSSKGPTAIDHIVKPDLVAPGNRVVSLYKAGQTLASLYPINEVLNSYYVTGGSSSYSSTYFTLSGTSMATPVVSGAVALLLQQHSDLTPDQVKARLMKTA